MTTLVIILIGVFVAYRLVTIMWYGRGILFPNFERVDRILAEKTPAFVSNSWSKPSGRIIYYFLLLLFLLLLYAVLS